MPEPTPGQRLRVVTADDERPARALIAALLRSFDDVELVGEATNGTEAVELIERLKPDLALLDLQMPELDGLGVVRVLRRDCMPLVAFVTAYDEFAVKAFEMNAVDYLLKPVELVRLRATISRVLERLDQADFAASQPGRVRAAAAAYSAATGVSSLRRIPVRKKEHIVLLPVEQICTIVADGEILHITTANGERCHITFRLKDVEARLDPEQFVRLSRGTLVNIAMIQRVTPDLGGTYAIAMVNGQQLHVSRIRSRIIREQLLRL